MFRLKERLGNASVADTNPPGVAGTSFVLLVFARTRSTFGFSPVLCIVAWCERWHETKTSPSILPFPSLPFHAHVRVHGVLHVPQQDFFMTLSGVSTAAKEIEAIEVLRVIGTWPLCR